MDQIFEGVEENFCGIGSELVPALKDLSIEYEVSELLPYTAPFLKHEYLVATKESARVNSTLLPTVKDLSTLLNGPSPKAN